MDERRQMARPPHARTAVAIILLSSTLTSCGVADPAAPGRCTKGTPTETVAGGEGWSIDTQPSSVTIKCSTPSTDAAAVLGSTQFIAVVKDATKLPVAGISIGASVPENSGMLLVTEENLSQVKDKVQNSTIGEIKIFPSDKYTDSCGVALFTVIYTCPRSAGLAVGGPLVVFSGSVIGSPTNISVELSEPADDDGGEDSSSGSK